MGRRVVEAFLALARFSQSTLMARALRICIVSRRVVMIFQITIPTTTELIRKPAWLYPAIIFLGGHSNAGDLVVARGSPSKPTAPGFPTVIYFPTPPTTLHTT